MGAQAGGPVSLGVPADDPAAAARLASGLAPAAPALVLLFGSPRPVLSPVARALSLALPGLAGILGIIAVALFLWLTVQFTKALHGFTSGPKVLLVMFGTLLVMGFVLSFFMAALGLMPEMPQ